MKIIKIRKEDTIVDHYLHQTAYYNTIKATICQPLSIRRNIDCRSLFPNKSFVRVHKRVNKRQKKWFEKGFPLYGLHYDSCENIETMLSHRNIAYKHICFDIGFGKGETIFQMALDSPDTLFIGVEPYKKGIESLLSKIMQNNVKNILIFHYDVVPILLHMVPDCTLDRIQIFFPDPWQKKRLSTLWKHL